MKKRTVIFTKKKDKKTAIFIIFFKPFKIFLYTIYSQKWLIPFLSYNYLMRRLQNVFLWLPDEDVYVVKNLNRFRHYECAIGWPRNQNIGSQVENNKSINTWRTYAAGLMGLGRYEGQTEWGNSSVVALFPYLKITIYFRLKREKITCE